MYGWPLGALPVILLVLSCLAVITIGSIALSGVRRGEFDRLQREVKRLSDDLHALQIAEQRRFLKELNSNREGDASAISESRPPDLQLVKPEKDAAPLL